MIYNLMLGVIVESDVSLERIGIQRRASLHLFPNQRLQVMLLALRYDLSPNLPAALHESYYDGLVIVDAASEFGLARLVHVSRLAADESLVPLRLRYRGHCR